MGVSKKASKFNTYRLFETAGRKIQGFSHPGQQRYMIENH